MDTFASSGHIMDPISGLLATSVDTRIKRDVADIQIEQARQQMKLDKIESNIRCLQRLGLDDVLKKATAIEDGEDPLDKAAKLMERLADL